MDKLIDRVNYRESQLIGLLGEQQGKYESGIPGAHSSHSGILYLPRSRPTSFAAGEIIKEFKADGVKLSTN